MRYCIIESCMRPSGAWARTQASFDTEAVARAVYSRAVFEGPGYGILWSKTLTLSQSYFAQGQYHRETLATRTCD